ncbi:MAG: isoprenylcysteine carboxylmethyltransferase family protein [Calditrichia bacterium]
MLLFFFLAQPTPNSFAAGIFWVIAGEILRIWSVAYTGKETRQHIINTPKLAVGGPYAFVRNPIYIGNLIIYSGVTIIANLWLPFFLFFVWLYFGLQYIFIVRAEENALKSAFGDAYDRYRQAVPGWFPALKPYPGERETADYRESIPVRIQHILEYRRVFGCVVLANEYLSINQSDKRPLLQELVGSHRSKIKSKRMAISRFTHKIIGDYRFDFKNTIFLSICLQGDMLHDRHDEPVMRWRTPFHTKKAATRFYIRDPQKYIPLVCHPRNCLSCPCSAGNLPPRY